jgi:MFS family permease
MLAAVSYIAAGLIFLIFLRPDPYKVANAISDARHAASQPPHYAGDTRQMDRKGIVTGACIVLLPQFISTGISNMTPIHMQIHGHSLNEIGFVIGMFIASMYLPSMFSGVLTDKLGRAFMACAAAVTLMAAALLAAFAPAESLPLMAAALALLGLGWNLGFISGTAMIVDATSPASRAKIQGRVDVLFALAGACAGLLSGIVTAQFSYTALALSGGALALMLIPLLLWSRRKRHAEANDRQLSV